MRLLITNASSYRLSLSNGTALDPNGTSYVVLEDEAVLAYEEGQTVDSIAKELRSDFRLYSELKTLETASRVTLVVDSGVVKSRQIYEVVPDFIAGNAYPQNLTATLTGLFAFNAVRAGRIVDVALRLSEIGADAGADALSCELDVLLAANTGATPATCLTTKPKIAKAARSGTHTSGSTYESGVTGITQGVVKTTSNANVVSAGTIVTATFTVVRTGPGTEMAGPKAYVEVEYDTSI